MSETDDNLREAFSGESQANRRYLFFSYKAEDEGHSQAARLFRAVAEAETVHAYKLFSVMDGTGTTRDNLLAGTIGEHREFTGMYPLFIEKAKEEQDKKAQTLFEQANEVEKIHHGLFQKMRDALEAGEQLPDEPYLVCRVCGNTVAGDAPEKCPVCNSPRDVFSEIK